MVDELTVATTAMAIEILATTGTTIVTNSNSLMVTRRPTMGAGVIRGHMSINSLLLLNIPPGQLTLNTTIHIDSSRSSRTMAERLIAAATVATAIIQKARLAKPLALLRNTLTTNWSISTVRLMLLA